MIRLSVLSCSICSDWCLLLVMFSYGSSRSMVIYSVLLVRWLYRVSRCSSSGWVVVWCKVWVLCRLSLVLCSWLWLNYGGIVWYYVVGCG